MVAVPSRDSFELVGIHVATRSESNDDHMDEMVAEKVLSHSAMRMSASFLVRKRRQA